MSASCRSHIARSSALRAASAICTSRSARRPVYRACSSGVVAFAASVSRAGKLAEQFLQRLARSRRGRLVVQRHRSLEEEPVGGDVGLAVDHRLRHVDHPPRVADLHQRADLQLPMFSAAFDDRHHVFIDPQVLGRLIGSGRNDAGPSWR